jgi:hypothetical protein
MVVTSDSAAGEMIAAPRPWTARAATSHTSDWARPPAREATENSTRPAMKTRRRPSRSARRPPRSRKPPKVRVYALTTQDRSSWENSSARPIEGSATLTMDASRTMTNCVSARSASASHLVRPVEASVM